MSDPAAADALTVRRALVQSGLVPVDAQVLLAHVLGVGRAWLIAHATDPLPRDPADAFFALAKRRREGEPVAYLTGRREFHGLDLEVTPAVLIPRPETETLVEAALGLPAGARVLDVATGSGAVALALADERPDLTITGTDASPAALEVARANAARLRLEVTLREADLMDGAGGPFDAVLANLPYVAAADLPGLGPELAYEPAAALDGGPDGLALVRRLAAQAADVPFVALEVGAGQAAAVAALLAPAHPRIETCPDLSGIERVVVGRHG